MNLIRKWNSLSLIVRILIGLIIGAVLGFAVPQLGWIGIPGELFVNALKAIAPILVFVLVASSLANSKGGNMSKVRTVVVLYLTSTLLAAVAAVFTSFAFPVTIPLAGVETMDSTGAPQGMSEVVMTLLNSIVSNPVSALANANYIGILFWAVIFGIALKKSAPATRDMMSDLADAVSKAVRWVIACAPLGIMGLVFSAVAESGSEIFVTYGRLVALLVGTMLLVALIINPLIVGLVLRHNPYPLLIHCLRSSGVTAFFTRSSAANIPVNMEVCKSLGLDEDLYSVSIPLGSTVNMDGAAVTITIFSLMAAYTVGVHVTLPMSVFLSIVATFSACGASGVAGGSLMLVPLGCSLFGISNDIAMQLVGVGFIISVIQDSLETALNSSGDVLFTATAEFLEWKNQGRELPL